MAISGSGVARPETTLTITGITYKTNKTEFEHIRFKRIEEPKESVAYDNKYRLANPNVDLYRSERLYNLLGTTEPNFRKSSFTV